MDKPTLDAIFEKYNFSEEEQRLVNQAEVATTSKMNQSRVLSDLILAKQQQEDTKTLKRTARNTNAAISSSAQDIKNSVAQATEEIKRIAEQVNKTIEDFDDNTSKLAQKANNLLWWYVFATLVIAAGAIIEAAGVLDKL